MFRTIILYLLSMFLSFSVYGQETQSFKGLIVDLDNNPVDGATIRILNIENSDTLSQVISNSKGFFNTKLSTKQKGIIVYVSSLNYKPYIEKLENIGSLNQHIIKLESQETTLSQVIVDGKKPILERKLDRTIFNVSRSIYASGKNIFEVLKRTPSVQINIKEQIIVNGRSGVQLQINGKAIDGTPADINNILKNINSVEVERIEIITSPSAKYDASGVGGIINIILKKNVQRGTFIRLNSSIASGEKITSLGGGTIDYNLDKLGFYLSVNAKENNQLENTRTERLIERNKFNEDLYQTFWDNSASIRGGFEYNTIRSTISGSLRALKIQESIHQENKTGISLRQANTVDSILNSKNETKNGLNVYSGNIFYTLKFDTTEKKRLFVTINKSKYENSSDSYNSTQYRNSVGEQIKSSIGQIINLPYTVNINSGKADFETSLPFKIQLETGLKVSLTKSNNRSSFFENSGNSPYKINQSATNEFSYFENISAAYLTLSRNILKKVDVQFGLRNENTSIKSKLNSTQLTSTNKNNYNRFFPSVLASYNISDNYQFFGSYVRRIGRPNYRDLNPFVFEVNPYYSLKGNPNLMPEIVNYTELGSILYGKYNVILSTSNINNAIGELPIVEGLKTIVTKRNINKKKNINLSISVPTTISKHWQLENYFNLSKTKNDILYDQSLINSNTTFTYTLVNSFDISNRFRLELSASYYAPNTDGIYKTEDIYWLYVGGQLKLDKKKLLNLNISIDDLLKTYEQRITSDFQGQVIRSIGTRDSRRISIALSYSIKAGQNSKPLKKLKEASSDEQDRIK